MADYNPTIKRFAENFGPAIPNVEFCPTDLPRLHAHLAPYLPLQAALGKVDDFWVVMQGKVMAHDSMGFLVPAGYLLEQEAVEALANFGTGNVNFVTADLLKYDATDVANAVVNSRGELAALGEPVVYSMIRKDGDPLVDFLLGVAGSSTAVDCNDTMTWGVTIGNHVGVSFGSWPRSSSDVMSRAANGHLFNTGAAVGMEARKAEDDGRLERHESWRLAMEPKTVRTNYSLIYPVVAAYAPLIEGQAVAIAASMAAFPMGSRVTYDRDSNIVPFAPEAVVVGSLAGNDAADLVNVQAAIDATLVSLQKYHDRCVGQVIKKDTRHPKSLLNKVKTRWGSDVPGFEALDRMPGSATDGYNWGMHVAGATLGEVVISLFMR